MTLENAEVLYKSLLERDDTFHANDLLRRHPELKDITVKEPEKVAEEAPKEAEESPVKPSKAEKAAELSQTLGKTHGKARKR